MSDCSFYCKLRHHHSIFLAKRKVVFMYHGIRICIVLILALSHCSCSLLSPNNDASPIWKTQVFGNALLLVNIQPQLWNKYVLFPSEKNDSTYLTLLEQNSGSIKWQWAECVYGKEPLIDEQYVYQNTFCLQTIDGFYCINLDNGKTITRMRIPQGGGNSIQGLGSMFFNSINLSNLNQGTTQTGQFREVFSLPQEPEFRVIINSPYAARF